MAEDGNITARVHKFSKFLAATSKLYAPEGWHEACSAPMSLILERPANRDPIRPGYMGFYRALSRCPAKCGSGKKTAPFKL
jgi:hypothetical protein